MERPRWYRLGSKCPSGSKKSLNREFQSDKILHFHRGRAAARRISLTGGWTRRSGASPCISFRHRPLRKRTNERTTAERQEVCLSRLNLVGRALCSDALTGRASERRTVADAVGVLPGEKVEIECKNLRTLEEIARNSTYREQPELSEAVCAQA